MSFGPLIGVPRMSVASAVGIPASIAGLPAWMAKPSSSVNGTPSAPRMLPGSTNMGSDWMFVHRLPARVASERPTHVVEHVVRDSLRPLARELEDARGIQEDVVGHVDAGPMRVER